MASSWQQDKLFIQELNMENLQVARLRRITCIIGYVFQFFNQPKPLTSLALSGQFRPYTNPASLKTNKGLQMVQIYIRIIPFQTHKPIRLS